jgi:hypothetical protein
VRNAPPPLQPFVLITARRTYAAIAADFVHAFRTSTTDEVRVPDLTYVHLRTIISSSAGHFGGIPSITLHLPLLLSMLQFSVTGNTHINSNLRERRRCRGTQANVTGLCMAMSVAAATPDREFQSLVCARYAGNPTAITDLGARIMVGRDAPCSPADGVALLEEAARQGDARAWAFKALLAAAGVGRTQSWLDALTALHDAADLGDAQSLRQMELLYGLGVHSAGDVEHWLSAAQGTIISDAPRLVSYVEFLPRALCRHLIESAAQKLTGARVCNVHRGSLETDPMRTNTGAAFSLIDTDVVFQLIRARIARTARIDFEAFEPPEVLHYAVGEHYRAHFDFLHPAVPQFAEQLRTRGQRVKTCLVYLNNGYDGGHTEFPNIGIKFRGGPGDALFFDNVHSNGNVDMDTLHAGVPPLRGEKWLLSQWMRDKRQRVA